MTALEPQTHSRLRDMEAQRDNAIQERNTARHRLAVLADMHDVIDGECIRCASPAPCDHLRVIHGETQ